MRQQKRHRCIEQSFGLCGRGRVGHDLGEWHWNMYNITFLWLGGPEEMATPSSILAWEISQTEDLGSPWGHTELDMTETT